MIVTKSAALASAVALAASLIASESGANTGSSSRARVGTIETVAGPQFCKGRSTLDPVSDIVGSMAVSSDGQIYFDTGGPAAGDVAKVSTVGEASLVAAAVPFAMGSAGRQAPAPTASRMAADKTEGIFVATATRILHLARGLSTVSGADPAALELAPTNLPDPGSYRDARFGRIMSLASDGGGNLYVADRSGEGSAVSRIRIINRGFEPLVLYTKPGRQVAVPAGSIATIDTGASDSREEKSHWKRSSVALAVKGPLLYIAADPGSVSRHRGSTVSPRVTLVNVGGEPVVAHGVRVPAGASRRIAGAGKAGFAGDGGRALSARFSSITGLAVDEHGSLFLADRMNHRVRRVDAAGRITTFAGAGAAGKEKGGFNGNGIPATRARLNAPFDVKTGPDGRLYISDSLNGQIRLVDASGIIRAVPGAGIGRKNRCTSRPMSKAAKTPDLPAAGFPVDIGAAPGGRVFFVTSGQIKGLNASGAVDAVAGEGSFASGCPAPRTCAVNAGFEASGARILLPGPVAAARDGIYILDAAGFRIHFANLSRHTVQANGRRVLPGKIVPVAGNGKLGTSGDGGKALLAQIDPHLADIAADSKGNLFLSDPTGDKLRLIGPDGTIRSIAPEAGRVSDPQCCRPQGLFVDGKDNLYISETMEPRVWLWNRGSVPIIAHGLPVAPNRAVPIAGTGVKGFDGDGGPADQARLISPVGLAADASGNLYIADRAANNVRAVGPGGRIRTVAGTGQAGFNGDGLKGELTWLNEPHAVAVDRCGNLLIADSGNSRVRRLKLVLRCRPKMASGPG